MDAHRVLALSIKTHKCLHLTCVFEAKSPYTFLSSVVYDVMKDTFKANNYKRKIFHDAGGAQIVENWGNVGPPSFWEGPLRLGTSKKKKASSPVD